jgi:hypothetical protein
MKQSKARKHPAVTRPLSNADGKTGRSVQAWWFYLVACVVIAVPFSAGKYIEFNSAGAFDSGAYVYSAHRVLNGVRVGVDEKISARVGTLLVNMLGVKLFGFDEVGSKILQTLFQTVALVMMFIALHRLWGRWPAAVATLMAAFYLSAPCVAKFGNVKEQYMIACMVIGISCLVLRSSGGAWWWAVASGAFLAWGPLFKQTGTSAIGAAGLFVLVQPLLKCRTWRQTGQDLLLLVGGAVLSVAPVCLWLHGQQTPFEYYPYARIWQVLFPGEGQRVSAYIGKGRQMIEAEVLRARVFRYYGILILPIVMAMGACVCGLVRLALKKTTHIDRFVLLFAVWWILDMAFVWISPRSYEQYYLPLNASAAMLGGYLLFCYVSRLKEASFKLPWMVLGGFAVVLMITLSSPIVFGIKKSAHSGVVYKNQDGSPSPRNGYVQRYKQIKASGVSPWESVAAYMKKNSTPEDRIFVWGWVPGIYVKAQRISASSHAFTSEMHVRPLPQFEENVSDIVSEFGQRKPKFIVDTHKRHFPWDRPVLELWPAINRLKIKSWPDKARVLPANASAIAEYDKTWNYVLKTHQSFKAFGEEESKRFDIMTPLRHFIMQHYRFVRPVGPYYLYQLNSESVDSETL